MRYTIIRWTELVTDHASRRAQGGGALRGSTKCTDTQQRNGRADQRSLLFMGLELPLPGFAHGPWNEHKIGAAKAGVTNPCLFASETVPSVRIDYGAAYVQLTAASVSFGIA